MKKTVIKLWPLIIFAFALVIRFIFLNQFQHSPFFNPQVTGLDQSLYNDLAKDLAAGFWPADRLLYSHPLYPYILSFFYRAWAPDIYSAVVIQFIVGAFSCLLIYIIAKNIFSAKVGMISSVIAAVYGPFLFYEGLLVPTALSIFLNLSAVLFLLKISDKNLVRTFIAGMLAGCSLVTNSGIAPFILFAVIWIIWNLKTNKPALFTHLACFLIAVILPLTCLSLKQYNTEGRFDSFGAHGGINFYIGNNTEANGTFRAPLGFSPSAGGLSVDSAKYAEKTTGRKMSAAEISGFWYKQAFIYIKNHPFAWSKLFFTKFLLFWNPAELSDVADYYLSKEDSLLLKFNPFVFALIFPLSLLGAVWAGRCFKKTYLLYAVIGSFVVSCTLFFVNSRYRVSAMPFLIIFAGLALYNIFEKARKKEFEKLIICAVFIALIMVINYKYMNVDMNTGRYNLSVIYEHKGLHDRAINILKGLIAKGWNLPAAHFNLGVCYFDKGMNYEALAQFQEVLKARPQDRDSHFNSGIVYINIKKYQKAIYEFNKVLEADKEDIHALYGLGNALEQLGLYKDAARQYGAVLKIAPDIIQAKTSLKRALDKAKRP